MIPRVRWTCPHCGKLFLIPEGSESPAGCPSCIPPPVIHIDDDYPPPPPPLIQTTPRSYAKRKPSTAGLGLFIIKCLMVGFTILWPLMILGTATLDHAAVMDGADQWVNGRWFKNGIFFNPDVVWNELLASKAKFHTFVYAIEMVMLSVIWFTLTAKPPSDPH